MLILGRTLAGDAADQNIARELIRQYTLTPTGATGPNNAVLPANNSGIAYLNGISDAITLNPPPAEDDPILATLAKIGVGPNLQVSDAHLGPLATLAADIAVKVTAALLPPLTQVIQFVSAVQNRGWAIPRVPTSGTTGPATSFGPVWPRSAWWPTPRTRRCTRPASWAAGTCR